MPGNCEAFRRSGGPCGCLAMRPCDGANDCSRRKFGVLLRFPSEQGASGNHRRMLQWRCRPVPRMPGRGSSRRTRRDPGSSRRTRRDPGSSITPPGMLPGSSQTRRKSAHPTGAGCHSIADRRHQHHAPAPEKIQDHRDQDQSPPRFAGPCPRRGPKDEGGWMQCRLAGSRCHGTGQTSAADPNRPACRGLAGPRSERCCAENRQEKERPPASLLGRGCLCLLADGAARPRCRHLFLGPVLASQLETRGSSCRS